MKVTRVFADASGETHFEELEIPHIPIPTIALRCSGIAREIPFMDFHAASQRGLVVTLQGRFEIATTSGDRKLFEQGEWLFADDVGSQGHTLESIGGELVIMHIALPTDWTPPTALSAP